MNIQNKNNTHYIELKFIIQIDLCNTFVKRQYQATGTISSNASQMLKPERSLIRSLVTPVKARSPVRSAR